MSKHGSNMRRRVREEMARTGKGWAASLRAVRERGKKAEADHALLAAEKAWDAK